MLAFKDLFWMNFRWHFVADGKTQMLPSTVVFSVVFNKEYCCLYKPCIVRVCLLTACCAIQAFCSKL